jgi:hypothetical protein
VRQHYASFTPSKLQIQPLNKAVIEFGLWPFAEINRFWPVFPFTQAQFEREEEWGAREKRDIAFVEPTGCKFTVEVQRCRGNFGASSLSFSLF